MFSLKKGIDAQLAEPAGSLFRVVQQLLEACALHSVEFGSDAHGVFKSSMRDIAGRFEQVGDYKDLLILGGEANKTIQAYNQTVEKFIRDLSTEKQMAVEVLARSLLRVCTTNEKAAQTLREIEKELAKASRLENMRELRAKLEECAGILCLESEVQQAQYHELKDRLGNAKSAPEQRDQVTGLSTAKGAASRMEELALLGNQGFVLVFCLKNVDVVNRRFGFSSGDDVLRRFAAYLTSTLQGSDQLFRWRGPCFVVVAERFSSLDAIQSEALRIGVRGPETEIEKDKKCMLIRLTAATTAFSIPKGRDSSDVSLKIDQFAAEQFKLSPSFQ